MKTKSLLLNLVEPYWTNILFFQNVNNQGSDKSFYYNVLKIRLHILRLWLCYLLEL